MTDHCPHCNEPWPAAPCARCPDDPTRARVMRLHALAHANPARVSVAQVQALDGLVGDYTRGECPVINSNLAALLDAVAAVYEDVT